MNGILFSKLDEIAARPERLSAKTTASNWQIIPYETAEVSGNLLAAGELTTPEDVTLKLGLSGWHKVYISMMNMRSTNYLHLKLTDDDSFEGIQMASGGMKKRHCNEWCPTEFTEEYFWKCADLTGQDVILSKPVSYFAAVSNLVWIRCVPMTEEEAAAWKTYRDTAKTVCVHGHFDEDTNGQDQSTAMDKLLLKEGPLVGTDISEISMEISFDHTYAPDLTERLPLCLTNAHENWQRGDALFAGVKEEATKARVQYMHDHGISVYATNRMSVCAFRTPYSSAFFKEYCFAEAHPEYYCKTRTGQTVKVCSYAYEEVQNHVVGLLTGFMPYGFDGVTLIWHRGLHLSFEEPVLQRFRALYPDADPFVLPTTDPRLHGVWCSFMTEFMRKLRRALDECSDRHLKINVITDYCPETSLHLGLDVGQWAKEGLIDSVLQSNIELWEDTDGCLKEDGTIDLALYDEKRKRDYVMRRYIPQVETERICRGIRAYLPLCEPHGVELYGAFPWQYFAAAYEYPGIIAQMRQAGVRKFHMWNLNHAMRDLPEFHALSMAGHAEIDPDTYELKRIRVLSLDGSDISVFNPNWRG